MGADFFLYGPHEHPSRLVAYVVRSLLRDEAALCSEGKQLLDFLHVEEVASVFISLLESEVRGPVNIGSGKPVAVRGLLEDIGHRIGRAELIDFGARSASQPSRLWANIDRLADEVGWAPHYDLASGIERTIEWWRSSLGTLCAAEPRG